MKDKIRYKKECIIEGWFKGRITYACSGMRHQEEEEYYHLNKGDKVYIYRKLRGKK